MNIRRDALLDDAEGKIGFCLDQLEKADEFSKDFEWTTELCQRLTIEEVIGALVAAEHEIRELKDSLEETEEKLKASETEED